MAKQTPSNPNQSKSLVGNIVAGFQQAGSDLKQYAMDVISGQQFKNNFFKDSGAFDKWLAHGASEIANVVVKGEAAPIYTHMASPDQQDVANDNPEMQSTEPAAVKASVEPAVDKTTIEPPNAPTQQRESILDRNIAELQQVPELTEPELEVGK